MSKRWLHFRRSRPILDTPERGESLMEIQEFVIDETPSALAERRIRANMGWFTFPPGPADLAAG